MLVFCDSEILGNIAPPMDVPLHNKPMVFCDSEILGNIAPTMDVPLHNKPIKSCTTLILLDSFHKTWKCDKLLWIKKVQFSLNHNRTYQHYGSDEGLVYVGICSKTKAPFAIDPFKCMSSLEIKKECILHLVFLKIIWHWQ